MKKPEKKQGKHESLSEALGVPPKPEKKETLSEVLAHGSGVSSKSAKSVSGGTSA